MNVLRPPRIVVIAPGIGARLYRGKTVVAFRIRQSAPRAEEIRVEGRRMVVARMTVASRRVRLPDLDQRIRDTMSVLIQNAAGHYDPLALRRVGEVTGEVVIARADRVVAVDGTRQFAERMRDRDQGLLGRALVR